MSFVKLWHYRFVCIVLPSSDETRLYWLKAFSCSPSAAPKFGLVDPEDWRLIRSTKLIGPVSSPALNNDDDPLKIVFVCRNDAGE